MEELVIEDMKLGGNAIHISVNAKPNKGRVVWGKTEELALAALWLPFWKLFTILYGRV